MFLVNHFLEGKWPKGPIRQSQDISTTKEPLKIIWNNYKKYFNSYLETLSSNQLDFCAGIDIGGNQCSEDQVQH